MDKPEPIFGGLIASRKVSQQLGIGRSESVKKPAEASDTTSASDGKSSDSGESSKQEDSSQSKEE